MNRYPADTNVGLISDSHGQIDLTRLAVETLTNAGADIFIHTGDICDLRVLDTLAGNTAHIVFGNCDWDLQNYSQYAALLGLTVDHPYGQIMVGDKTIAFSHGDDIKHYLKAITNNVDYFCHGHTHEVRDEIVDSIRFINPGAMTRVKTYTVALLQPMSGNLTFLKLQKP